MSANARDMSLSLSQTVNAQAIFFLAFAGGVIYWSKV